jgi:hypothetical protein
MTQRAKQIFSSSLQGNSIRIEPNRNGVVYHIVARFQHMSQVCVTYRFKDKLMHKIPPLNPAPAAA